MLIRHTISMIKACMVACVAAGPRTRLNHLYSPSALYTEGLERLRLRLRLYGS